MEMAKIIGQAIKLGREEIGMSQRELAAKIGLGTHQKMISLWELGKVIPRVDHFFEVAKVFPDILALIPPNSGTQGTTQIESIQDYFPLLKTLTDNMEMQQKLSVLRDLSRLLESGKVNGGVRKITISLMKSITYSLTEEG